MRRKPPPIALQPIYVAPQLDRRERTAARLYEKAAFSGKRHIPQRGTFDPLEMRAGLRVHFIKARAGWVVSNPMYDRSLCDHPESDPSLPGPQWLWEVYRSHRNRPLVLLPGCYWATELRAEKVQAAERQEEPALRVGQLSLFAEAA